MRLDTSSGRINSGVVQHDATTTVRGLDHVGAARSLVMMIGTWFLTQIAMSSAWVRLKIGQCAGQNVCRNLVWLKAIAGASWFIQP